MYLVVYANVHTGATVGRASPCSMPAVVSQPRLSVFVPKSRGSFKKNSARADGGRRGRCTSLVDTFASCRPLWRVLVASRARRVLANRRSEAKEVEQVLEAVQRGGDMLEIASDALKADRAVVMAAVQRDGRATDLFSLGHADGEMRAAGVQQVCPSMRCVPVHLKEELSD